MRVRVGQSEPLTTTVVARARLTHVPVPGHTRTRGWWLPFMKEASVIVASHVPLVRVPLTGVALTSANETRPVLSNTTGRRA